MAITTSDSVIGHVKVVCDAVFFRATVMRMPSCPDNTLFLVELIIHIYLFPPMERKVILWSTFLAVLSFADDASTVIPEGTCIVNWTATTSEVFSKSIGRTMFRAFATVKSGTLKTFRFCADEDIIPKSENSIKINKLFFILIPYLIYITFVETFPSGETVLTILMPLVRLVRRVPFTE